MRFAKARMLTELPSQPMTDQDLDLVDEIVRRLQTTEDGRVGVTLGDAHMGKQMAMRLSPAQLEVPATVEMADRYGFRSVPDQLQSLVDPARGELPEHLMGVEFGWVDEGNPLGPMYFGKPKTREGQRWAAKQGYAGQLAAALPELMKKAGMHPGDLLYNSPYGAANGDYQRAKAYMRSGFGAPTTEHEQFARITAGGGLEPVMPFGVDQSFMHAMGWDTPQGPSPQPPVSAVNSPA